MLTEFNRYNTWVGDPARVLLFNAIYDFINKHNLVSHTADIGAHVYGEIEKLQKKFPNDIQNLRGQGQGTFIAWDCPWRDEFTKKMRAKGVHMGGCGERALRLRPILVFQRKYVLPNWLLRVKLLTSISGMQISSLRPWQKCLERVRVSFEYEEHVDASSSAQFDLLPSGSDTLHSNS
jgi:hypothetical protein